jgi:hypothetical protein
MADCHQGQMTMEDPDSLDAIADPTMAQCCIRDLQQQRKSAALRRQLEQVDVSTQRQTTLLHVVSTATPGDSTSQNVEEELHDENDPGMFAPAPADRVGCCPGLSSLHLAGPDKVPAALAHTPHLNAELARLRELRLQQLKTASEQKQELQRHGHGQLNLHQGKEAYVSDDELSNSSLHKRPL